MKEHSFDSNGATISYRTSDFQSDRQTLVFVHGLSGSSSAWLEYENYFEKRYNVLTFDLRGHGKSSKPKEYAAYTIKHFADDLHRLIEHLGIKTFILISHSFGTLIALEFLAKHQNQVTASVFLCPGFAPDRRIPARILKFFLNVVPLFEWLPFTLKPGTHIDYLNHPNTGDWNIRRMIADVGNTTLRVYLYATRQAFEFDREKFLSEIHIPVLIMQGNKDTIFPVQNAITMAEKIPHSRLNLLEGTDHIIVLNNFSEVSAAIDLFLQDIPGK